MATRQIPLPDERDRFIPGSRSVAAPADASDAPLDVEELENGDVKVREPEAAQNDPGEFGINLAEVLEENELNSIAQTLMQRIEFDKQSRRKRDTQYAEGLKRTGISEPAPGGAEFHGASKATHPVLAEACIDFAASAMRELFPSQGPVRTEIIGEQTQEKLAIAERQFKFLNWYLTKKMEEYPEELGQTMTQLGMAGSQYMKFWGDDTERRVRCEFAPIDDVLIPYGASSFWSASRITHVQRLDEVEWEERVESGMYRDIDPATPSMVPETTKAGAASERIEGVESPAENLDGLRLAYEVNTYLKISKDGKKRLPYLITLCERTQKVIALYRNWEENDPKCERLHWLVDFNFIMWRGAYKLGFAGLIGGLSSASTGALRALLDSALVNSIPVLAKLKGAKFGGQSKEMKPQDALEVEAGNAVDDIRKVLMAMPFNPPSPVLMQLLGWLTDAAKGVVTTAEEKIAEANSQMPVGTTLALIEQGAKVFSTIHAGLHRSQMKALKVIVRILKDFIDEQDQVEEFGEVICTQEDLMRPLGVVPVSDPNIFSEGQRYAQMHLVDAYSSKYPQLHNLYEVVHSSYRLAKIQNIDKLLPPPKEPTETNAAAENSSVMLGNPIMAFPEQDHVAHLETHVRFIKDPLFGSSPVAVGQSYPQMAQHIKQHLAFLYAKTMHDAASQALGIDLGEAIKDKRNWANIDKVLAAASNIVHHQLNAILAPLGQDVQALMQQIQKMQQPPPMDPSQAALQVAQIEDKRKREEAQLKDRQERDKLMQKAQSDADKIADRERQTEVQAALAAAKISLDGGQAMADAHAAVLDRERQRLEAERQHALSAGDQAHAQDIERRRLTLDQIAQQHQQMMDRTGQAHQQRMDVAGHLQQQREHADGVAGQNADRFQGSVQHAASIAREREAAAESEAAAARQRAHEAGQSELDRRAAAEQAAASAKKPPAGGE